jgi:ribonuclease R
LVFTIDGEETRAFDDAISLKEISPGRYRVGIHISDVANVIEEGS